MKNLVVSLDVSVFFHQKIFLLVCHAGAYS